MVNLSDTCDIVGSSLKGLNAKRLIVSLVECPSAEEKP